MSNKSKISLNSLKRPYVVMAMESVARSLAAASEVDEVIQKEIRRLPTPFSFQLCVLPSGPSVILEKVGDCRFRYVGRGSSDSKTNVALKFKHMNHAFLMLSLQEGTARAYANDRILVDGEVSDVMKLIRSINRLESLILPKLVAQWAVKRYPRLAIFDKLTLSSRIYAHFLKNLVWK